MSSRHQRFAPLLPTALFMAALQLYIHTVLAPDHLAEQPYIGVGFVIADVLLAMVMVGLLVRRVRLLAWILGATLCAGMFTAFLLSRTTGLPGYHETWTSDGGLGLVSLAAEIAFIGCAIASVRLRRAEGRAYLVEVRDAARLPVGRVPSDTRSDSAAVDRRLSA